ncbi:MAG: hypothetical protein JXA20_01240 [Spirochaetes bacterium]|nr:hypothetical protein [Spirochaetota bacterium]
MDNYVSVIFCKRCGSRYVDISEWSERGRVIFHCRSCDYREEVIGFTLGRANISNRELQQARDTVPKKGSYER